MAFFSLFKALDYSGVNRLPLEGLIECRITSTCTHPMNWSEFFAMGGYATYVWASYGLMGIILILNLVLPLRKKADALEKARRFIARGKTS